VGSRVDRDEEIAMIRAGRIIISNELIQQALQFPPNWIIEIPYRQIEVVITGHDFPEVATLEEAPLCTVTITKTDLKFEVIPQ
jgi:hypothetical protein